MTCNSIRLNKKKGKEKEKKKSDSAETWWVAFGKHGDSELLKSFRLDIQNCLKFFK